MCIRDRHIAVLDHVFLALGAHLARLLGAVFALAGDEVVEGCLLYTSDAADERSSVDLGGRRIIKKKTNTTQYGHCTI
mgnify:CR=1 FL=1